MQQKSLRKGLSNMAIRKQKQEALRIKREKREAEIKASGLKAQAEDRKRRAEKKAKNEESF